MIHLKNALTQWFLLIGNICYNKKVYYFNLLPLKYML